VSERWRKRGGRGGGRGEGTGCERLIGNNGQVERERVCVCVGGVRRCGGLGDV